MAKHGDRTGSAKHTREVDFCAKRTGELGAIIHMSTSHESANEEECDARGSTNRSKCNQTAELDEFRGFDPGAWIKKNRERSPGATCPRIRGGRLKDEFHSIAAVEDAPRPGREKQRTAKRRRISRDREPRLKSRDEVVGCSETRRARQ